MTLLKRKKRKGKPPKGSKAEKQAAQREIFEEMIEGVVETAVKQYRNEPSPGTTWRAYRVSQLRAYLLVRIMRKLPSAKPGVIEAVLQRAVAAHQPTPEMLAFLEKHFAGAEPLPPSDRWVTVKAILQIGEIRWLIDLMAHACKRRADREFGLACLLYEGWGPEVPQHVAAIKTCGHFDVWNWALGLPHVRKKLRDEKRQFIPWDRNRVYEGVTRVCDDIVQIPSTALVHASLGIWRRRVDLAGGFWRPTEHFKGSPPLTHGVHLVVDGKIFAAWTEQGALGTEADRAKRRERFPRAAFMAYTRKSGYVLMKVFGWKILVISDGYDGTPLIWALLPANADEPHHAERLFKELIRLVPDIPACTLSGDGIYFARVGLTDTLIKHRVQPIFPSYGKAPKDIRSAGLASGVPRCGCPGKPLMKRWSSEKWPTYYRGFDPDKPEDRRILDEIPAQAEIRWRCAQGVCAEVRHKLEADPRIVTLYPRAGDSDMAMWRKGLQLRRMIVESLFAVVEGCFSLGGKDLHRLRWGGDEAADWLVGLSFLFLQAERYVHESGLYEKTHEQADKLGWFDPLTEAGWSITPEALAAAEAVLAPELPRVPKAWNDDAKAREDGRDPRYGNLLPTYGKVPKPRPDRDEETEADEVLSIETVADIPDDDDELMRILGI